MPYISIHKIHTLWDLSLCGSVENVKFVVAAAVCRSASLVRSALFFLRYLDNQKHSHPLRKYRNAKKENQFPLVMAVFALHFRYSSKTFAPKNGLCNNNYTMVEIKITITDWNLSCFHSNTTHSLLSVFIVFYRFWHACLHSIQLPFLHRNHLLLTSFCAFPHCGARPWYGFIFVQLFGKNL